MTQLEQVLHLDLLVRLLLAVLLGGIIGLEREIHGKPAGLRTNILICVGAALLMEISMQVAAFAQPGQPGDPARIAAQVVSGIGFIGAGTILVARGHVVGLTTAATLWVVAAIGLAVGARAYVEAVGTTVLVATTLVVLGYIENYLLRRRTIHACEITMDPRPELLDRVTAILEAEGLRVTPVEITKGEQEYKVEFELAGSGRGHNDAVRWLTETPGVRRISLK